LRANEIDWVEAAGNYVRLHPDTFFRIHRSRIVNIARIKEVQPWFNGEYVVILRNGTKLTLSRGYREKLQERLGRPL